MIVSLVLLLSNTQVVLYIAFRLYNMFAQYVCLRNTAHSSSRCMLTPQNITKYHKTCFQSPWTVHKYLQISAMNHPFNSFYRLWQNTQVRDIRPIWVSCLSAQDFKTPSVHALLPLQFPPNTPIDIHNEITVTCF